MNGIFNIFSNITDGLSIMFLNNLWEGLLSLIIKLSMWVLGLIRPILRLIFNVARIDFFGEDIIGDLLGRVYMILGILMLFKITISCVQYLINPDKADDKENGFGGIIKRTIICVMLLALVKPIFNFAKEAQMAIIETLPKVILGTEKGIDTDDITENIAYTTALGFFGYNEGCNNGKIGGLSGASSNALFNSIEDISKNSEIITGDKSCNGNSAYSFNYLCIFAAGFLVVVLVSMAIDVGIRTIKFGFLQLIAPVPIASYIDPKTSKKSFDSWVHNSISVYVDLFIRLGVIYFILFLFKTIMSTFKGSYVLTGGETITGFDAGFVNVLIIIALFMFAKNAPKFICDVLGIKDSGSLTDMFKRAGGLAGTGLGALKTARSNYTTQKERLKGKGKGGVESRLRAALSAAAGAGSATGRGLKMTASGKGFKDVRRDAFKNAIGARDARNDRVDNLYAKGEYNWMDYQRDKRRSDLGIPSQPGYKKAVYDVMDTLAQSAGAEKSFGATKMNERPDLIKVNINGVDYSIATARSYANIQVGTENVTKPDGTVGTWTVEDQAKAMSVKETVEKKTSYIMTARLINENDPTAKMNHEKTILAMKNNQSMFNVEGVMEEITKIFREKGVISNKEDMTYDRMINYMENMPKDENEGAKIIDAVKTSFENIRTNRYAAAQAAEARAKKTQQAIQNDKKGS